jgi:UDP-N-acetylglucosamine 4-epimerase
LNTLWENLQNISGKKIAAVYGPTRKGDVRDSLANVDKARKLLGYDPLFSIKDGLELTWEWF